MNNAKIQDPETYAIIGAAMSVHKTLGCGFLEAVYQEALEKEFIFNNIPYEREKKLEIEYKGSKLNSFYKADYICYNSIVVELKALGIVGGKEESQVINYLKATGYQRGLLLNFGSRSLGYKRFINTKPEAEENKKQNL